MKKRRLSKKKERGLIPSKIQIMDEMYADCINLKKMPVVPDTVTSVRNAFAGDISLVTLTNIPSSVTDISNCFMGCKRAEGSLIIDATPGSYGCCFQGAVVGTKLVIKGTSKNLSEIITDAGNRNITADGILDDYDENANKNE